MDHEAYHTLLKYIDENPIAILGTSNPDGSPHGAVVYMCADDHQHELYFLTKTKTQKYENILVHPAVSVTIVNPTENSSLQASGRATVVQTPDVIERVMKKITYAHASASEWLPPLAKLRAGAYVVVGIQPTKVRLAHFKGRSIGDQRIFTQLL